MARIVTNPKILAGKPIMEGTRIAVYLILNLIAHGKTMTDIRSEYPALTGADIKAALTYAARHMKYEETHVLEA